MNTALKNYLDIYTKFPPNEYYSKEQRKLRYTMIKNWENSKIEQLPIFEELKVFLYEYKNKIDLSPQFFKKFESVWRINLESSYEFAELIIDMDLVELMSYFDISSIYMADQVLKYKPNHLKALTLKLRCLVRYHDFCMHEIPWGILVEGSLDEELNSIQLMEDIAKQISFNNPNLEILISYCKKYYPLWFEYLKETEKYPNGFKDFLSAKDIDTDRLHINYILI